MEHLPPVGLADVATKHDLDQLETRLELRLEAFEHRLLAGLRAELIAQSRIMIFFMGTVLAVAGVTLTALSVT